MATMERLNPVLPELVSMIVVFSFINPSFSAVSTMCSAIRSLLEWPGLLASYLAKNLPL